MADKSLELSWINIWKDISNPKLVEIYWNKILKAYSYQGRFYHNIDHIRKMISESVKYSEFISDIKTLQLSIFYHDIVYSIKSDKNELRSALTALKSLEKLKYPNQQTEKCKQFILATKQHVNNLNDSDLDFLLDFDLAVLGDSWDGYYEYTQQIRQEYRIYPDIVYKQGRKKVLTYFLNLENIYKTDLFRANYEKVARQNLFRELSLL
jgi:predicted metal-dependent HD superfamily phosphohydrolase